MIIVKLLGGLGNQMFQYACARNVAIRFGTKVLFDLDALFDEESRNLHAPRYYELGCFSLPQNFASEADLKMFVRQRKFFARLKRHLLPRRVIQERSLQFDSSLAKRARPRTHLSGYWQSEKYFLGVQNQIHEDFKLVRPLSGKAREVADLIKTRATVSLHVRRGDYVDSTAVQAYHGVCGPDYYRNAMDRIASRVKEALFVVFSDDPDWCRRNFSKDGEILVVEPSFLAAEDMFLMSLCNHHIIANSSFSWWGAWLNPDPGKIIIAPRPWISGSAENQPDIYPPGWIVLDRQGHFGV